MSSFAINTSMPTSPPLPPAPVEPPHNEQGDASTEPLHNEQGDVSVPPPPHNEQGDLATSAHFEQGDVQAAVKAMRARQVAAAFEKAANAGTLPRGIGDGGAASGSARERALAAPARAAMAMGDVAPNEALRLLG